MGYGDWVLQSGFVTLISLGGRRSLSSSVSIGAPAVCSQQLLFVLCCRFASVSFSEVYFYLVYFFRISESNLQPLGFPNSGDLP